MTIAVAIDGPSGAGKSTVGRALARRIGARFVDTGLMYRALTLAALEQGIDLEDGPVLAGLADTCRIEVERAGPDSGDQEAVLLDGRDVTAELRSPEVDRAVSAVSRHAEVRQAMLPVQRAAAFRGDVVMVGRDIGTVVLPDATLKVYLTASAEVRAARRAAEMGTPERIGRVPRGDSTQGRGGLAARGGAVAHSGGRAHPRHRRARRRRLRRGDRRAPGGDRCVAGSGTRARSSPAGLDASCSTRGSRASSTCRATGPFIIVSNHTSNVDPPLVGWATGHQVGRVIHFMAKIEMRSWPFLGWLATQSAVFFVRRGEGDRAAQRFSLETLAAGRPIGLFAEGTRSRDGHLKPLKSGAAFLAMRSGAPLLPVGIAGTHRLFPGHSRWPHADKDQDPHRRAVHAAASAGWPAGSRGAGRRDRSDHERNRGAPAGGAAPGSIGGAYIRTSGRHPAGTLEWTR